MATASRFYSSNRGSITIIEAVVTLSIGAVFLLVAYKFQQHSQAITDHDKCVMQKISELENTNKPVYDLADPQLLEKLRLDCPENK